MPSSIDEFEDEYGTPEQLIAGNGAREDLQDSGLPPVIFDFWEKFGFSKFLDGYFQILDPRKYASALNAWLSGTVFADKDRFYAIRMDAFGNLNVYGATISAPFRTSVGLHGLISSGSDDSDLISKGRANVVIESAFFRTLADDVVIDSSDVSIRLFFAAKEKLGILGPNQIYAPDPAIPLGGQMRIEDLQIVNAPEYLTMVAELAPIRVLAKADLARLAYGEGADKMIEGLLRK